MKIPLPCLPTQIEGIDGNAVPAESGAWIERLETEGLRRGGANYLPDVDTHLQAKQFELIHQGDVDAAVNVLQQLGHFRNRRRRNRHNATEDCAVHTGS